MTNRINLAARVAAVAAIATSLAVAPATSAGAADPPANDLFENATPVVLDFAETIDTTMATTGQDEDFAGKAACGSPPFDSPAPPDATVWYSLVVAETVLVHLSSVPQTYSSGFNVFFDDGGHDECVAGGPGETGFLAEAGITYFIQVIDDQFDGGGNGGTLNFSATSLGPPLPEVCPGISPNDPNLPPGLNLILGTDGDDSIRGTDGDDLIFGLEGNDDINGGGGNDVIFGCGGDDDINGGDGDDFVFGDSADFFGDPTNDNGGDDDINGGKGNDQIRGGPGDDSINGGDGDDELFGNQGDDDIMGGKGDDFAVGGFGSDSVHGGQGNDGVFGGFDSDRVNGGPGDDEVDGDAPAPFPDDSPHTDTCNGGNGNDIVTRCEIVNGKP